MKTKFVLLALLSTGIVQAAEQRFVLDLKKVPAEDRGMVEMLCTPEYRVDSAADLAIVVVKELVGYGGKIQEIEKTRSTDGRAILTRTYIAKRAPLEGYPYGVYWRVAVSQKGTGANRSEFTLNSELLNYRDSAEIGEGSVCDNLTYVIAKGRK